MPGTSTSMSPSEPKPMGDPTSHSSSSSSSAAAGWFAPGALLSAKAAGRPAAAAPRACGPGRDLSATFPGNDLTAKSCAGGCAPGVGAPAAAACGVGVGAGSGAGSGAGAGAGVAKPGVLAASSAAVMGPGVCGGGSPFAPAGPGVGGRGAGVPPGWPLPARGGCSSLGRLFTAACSRTAGSSQTLGSVRVWMWPATSRRHWLEREPATRHTTGSACPRRLSTACSTPLLYSCSSGTNSADSSRSASTSVTAGVVTVAPSSSCRLAASSTPWQRRSAAASSAGSLPRIHSCVARRAESHRCARLCAFCHSAAR
mmetsp:Transcript_17769/g.45081  ORF Transcript_17769/g.45081 Transcript_17769/m.45081 type:complete len:313 (-) Transcript_17769:626-1564(-)